jgi:phosphatidate cytidylyltransferase
VLPGLLFLLGYANPMFLTLFLGLILLLGLLEFNRMGLADECRLEQYLSAVIGAFVLPLLVLGQQLDYLVPFLTASFLLLALLRLLRAGNQLQQAHFQLAWLMLGLCYLPLLLSHVISLRLLEQGRAWIFLTLLAIMSCDTLAYFIGSRFGRRKLYPAISPKKTVEGALGGLVGAILGVLLVSSILLPQLGWFDIFFLGLILGTAGQLGDLFESFLKRACQVKDSGSMIPGHGGILDRLDSLLFAFPLAYYLAKYLYGA